MDAAGLDLADVFAIPVVDLIGGSQPNDMAQIEAGFCEHPRKYAFCRQTRNYIDFEEVDTLMVIDDEIEAPEGVEPELPSDLR